MATADTFALPFLDSDALDDRDALRELVKVSLALSRLRDPEKLLPFILREARRTTRADAGTLYLVRGAELEGRLAQNDTLAARWGDDAFAARFARFRLSLDGAGVAAAAARGRHVVHVPDVRAPDAAFAYNPALDRENGYETRSLLAVPMLDREGRVLGVLQLINARADDGAPGAFSPPRIVMACALASQAGVAVESALLTRELVEAHRDTLHRLGLAAEWRDRETGEHIQRVALVSERLALRAGWSSRDARDLRAASGLHDVGKLGVPDAILHKPGALDAEERAVMQRHPAIGANLLADSDDPLMILGRAIAHGHHERWDGRGYPAGAAGEAIPEAARIVAVADVWDALATRRPYKEPMSFDQCAAVIRDGRGTHFDPGLAELFLEGADEYARIALEHADTDEAAALARDCRYVPLAGDDAPRSAP